MNFYRSKIILLLFALTATLPVWLWGQDFQLKRELVQATTHPDIDITPRISPDGKWMAYVNRNSGNFDIWLQSTAGGRAIPLTKHKADDFYPVWGPKSRSIVFVSQRSDAAGDIWRIKLRAVKKFLLPKGKPQQISHFQGLDSYPTISPDGKKTAWVSNRTGRDEIWFHNDNTGKTTQLTFLGGTHPAWSPNQELIAFTSFRAGLHNNGDIWIINLHGRRPSTAAEKQFWDPRELPSWQITQGPAMDGFPAWSPDAKSLVFVRYDQDTNGDRRISPDDKAMLWSATVTEEPDYGIEIDPLIDRLTAGSFIASMVSRAFPLTAGAEFVSQPSFGGKERLYFVADRQGNLDAWSSPEIGYIPQMASADSQYAFAEKNFPLPEAMAPSQTGPLLLDFDPASLSSNDRHYLGDRIIAFHRVIDFFEHSSGISSRALYQIGLTYSLLGYYERAARYHRLVLELFAEDAATGAYSEMALLGLSVRRDSAPKPELVTAGLEQLIQKHQRVEGPVIAASIYLGDIYARQGKLKQAEKIFRGVLERYSSDRRRAAEVLFKLAALWEDKDPEKSNGTLLKIISDYPDQQVWLLKARDRILDKQLDGKTKIQQVELCSGLLKRYQGLPRLAAAVRLRRGKILTELDDANAALKAYEMVELEYPELTDDLFAAQTARADILINQGQVQAAFELYENLAWQYSATNPLLGTKIQKSYLKAIINSADDLKAGGNFSLAKTRYKKAISLSPKNLQAHKGYIESFYRRGEIDLVIEEYNKLNPFKKKDNILIYALGLAYSYKGTEKAERVGNPGLIDINLLHNSSRIVAIALSYDYSLVEAYLTIAFNYEMTENYLDYQRAKPVPYYKRAFNMVIAPILSIYRTLTFYEETKPPRYYERAIHELTKAITLNDERENPRLEAALALNLANNYYSLGEFGFDRAYQNYRIKLDYDSTFVNRWQKAKLYERLGHSSLYVEDMKNGPAYLQTAIDLYGQLGQIDKTILNLKRLALLHETGGQYDLALANYQSAALLEERSNKLVGLMRSYRSIAFNYLQSGRPQEAISYAQKSLDILQSGKIPTIKDQPHRVKFGFLGLYLPIPFVNLAAMGASSGTVLTTEQEKAFAYTILGEGYLQEKEYLSAIKYLEKKLIIYRNRDDFLAVATFLNNIGYLYFQNQDLKKAGEYFSESLELSERKKITRGFFENSLNLARVYLAAAAEKSQRTNPQFTDGELRVLRDYAAEKINRTLTQTDDREEFFGPLRTRLYLLLAQMSFLNADAAVGENFEGQITAMLGQINQLSVAKTYIEEASRISSEQKLWPEYCLSRFAMGTLYSLIQNPKAAYPHLIAARDMALKNGLNNYLWKINTSLADLLATMDRETKVALKIQKAPFEYYAEAIDVLEAQSTAGGKSHRSEPCQAHQAPYRKAVSYLAEKGDWLGALVFSERMRSLDYLSLLTDENLSLADTASATSYLTAKSLQQQINKTRIKLLRSRTRLDVSPAERSSLTSQLADLQKQYNMTLKKIGQINPQIESLVRPSHIPIATFQKNLRPDEAAITFLLQDNQVFEWWITAREITHRTAGDQKELNSLLIENLSQNSYTAALRRAASSLRLPEFFADHPEIERIVVIPDFRYYQFPWDEVVNSSTARKQGIIVSIGSSLSSYYYASSKRRESGDNIYLGNAGYLWDYLTRNAFTVSMPTANSEGNSFASQLSSLRMADFIHLDVTQQWNAASPVRSLAGFPIKGSTAALFSPFQIYSLSLNPATVAMDFDSSGVKSIEPLIAFEKSLIFSGVPSIIFSLGVGRAELKKQFYSEFYQNARLYSPGFAFRKAKEALTSRGVSSKELARFQLYGYNGEMVQEKVLFEEMTAEALIEAGDLLIKVGDYKNGIDFYWNAANALGESQGTARASLLEKIKSTALNVGRWRDGVRAQQILNAGYFKNRKTLKAAMGLYAQSFFYLQLARPDSAAALYRQGRNLSQQYGLLDAEPLSWLLIASQIKNEAEAENALSLLDKAESIFQSAKNGKGVADSKKEKGRIYSELFKDYAAALPPLKEAWSFFLDHNRQKESIETGLLLGPVYRHIGDLSESIRVFSQIVSVAESLAQEKLSARSLAQLALSQHSAGLLTTSLNNLNAAINIYARLGEEQALIRCLQQRGLIYLSRGKAEIAMRDELNALEKAMAVQADELTAAIYYAMGRIELSNNNYLNAMANFSKAAETDSLYSARPEFLRDSFYLARTALLMGHSQKAQEILSAITADPGAMIPERQAIRFELLLAETALSKADRRQAEERARIALERSLARFDGGGEIASRLILADLLSETRPDSALEHLSRASDLLLDRDRFDEQNNLLFSPDTLFNRLVAMLLRSGKQREALIAAERAKIFSLSKTASLLPISVARFDSLATSKKKTAKERFLLNRAALEHLYHLDRDDTSAIRRQSEKTIQALARYKQAKEKSQKQNPAHSDWFVFDDSSLAHIIKNLPPKTAVVDYYLANRHLYTWIISGGDLSFTEQIIDEAEAESLSASIQDSLGSSGLSATPGEFYDRLISSVQSQVKKGKALYIVAHGPLYGINFASLVDSGGSYLGLDYAISKVPLLTTVHSILNEQIPNYPKSVSIFDVAPRELDPELQYIQEKELMMVSRFYDQVRLFRHQQASKSSFLKADSQFILFYRGPVVPDVNEPLASQIIFSADSISNGRMTAAEFLTTSHNNDLMILKNTNVNLTAQPAIVAVLNALLYSGSRSVLLNSDSMPGLSSTLLLKRFFIYRSAGYSKGEALRLARQFVHDHINSRPDQWTGMDLWGALD